MTMVFAIEEINKNLNLLPNVTLGYSLYDNCGALVVALSGALSLASGQEEQFLLQENCSGIPPVLGLVGDHYSTFSIAISSVLSLYNIPIVSFKFHIFMLALCISFKCSIDPLRYILAVLIIAFGLAFTCMMC